jgi:hypothetical protein
MTLQVRKCDFLIWGAFKRFKDHLKILLYNLSLITFNQKGIKKIPYGFLGQAKRIPKLLGKVLESYRNRLSREGLSYKGI